MSVPLGTKTGSDREPSIISGTGNLEGSVFITFFRYCRYLWTNYHEGYHRLRVLGIRWSNSFISPACPSSRCTLHIVSDWVWFLPTMEQTLDVSQNPGVRLRIRWMSGFGRKKHYKWGFSKQARPCWFTAIVWDLPRIFSHLTPERSVIFSILKYERPQLMWPKEFSASESRSKMSSKDANPDSANYQQRNPTQLVFNSHLVGPAEGAWSYQMDVMSAETTPPSIS